MADNPLINLERSKPKWDSGLGYLFLLDDIIKLACGYLISEDLDSYYQTLESWYLSTIYWFKTSPKVKDYKVAIKTKEGDKKIPAIDQLDNLRSAADATQLEVLKNYHELLDYLTNLAGLRLSSASALPGVLNQ